MKRLSFLVVVCLLLSAFPVSASDYSAYKVDSNDQVVVGLLWLVSSDLQMCRASLNKSAKDTVSAIGHLNNAQSALKKADIDASYSPLIGEILARIGKIKFYLVMQDFRSVNMRLNQLMQVIRSSLGGQLPDYSVPTGYLPGSSSGFTPSKPVEYPVGNTSGIGQNVVAPGLPSSVIPNH